MGMRLRMVLVAGAVALGVAGCGREMLVATEAAPAPAWSTCEISHVDGWWGVYGATSEPRGTEFTFTLTVDGEATEYPLVAKAGSIYVDGELYGHPDGYVDDGTNTDFGFTSADMPYSEGGSGHVTLRGRTVC